MSKNPFSAAPYTATEVLQKKLGSVGYRVPEYQREYRWSTKHIERLIEDVFQGLLTHAEPSKQSTVTFIGTIILVADNQSDDPYFQGQSLSIVDGQQRLTTLAILLCRIDSLCHYALTSLDPNKPAQDWLRRELTDLRARIFPCLATGNFNLVQTSPYQFVPKIARASEDVRAHSQGEANYESPIAKYLFAHIKFVLGERAGQSVEPPTAASNSKLSERIYDIDSNLQSLFRYSTDTSEVSSALSALFDKKPFRELFTFLTTDHKDLIESLIKDIESTLEPQAQNAALVTTFANYLLSFVQMIFVEVSEEQYAFEVFEALNTTGESLTAFETFKPIVIRKENDSKSAFERLQAYAEASGSSEKQKAVSETLVTSLALYVSGSKKGKHLAEQRKYLQETYLRQKSPKQRHAFVQAPVDLVEYRERFWDSPAESGINNLGAETQRVYACACFLRSTNTHLSIPILTRFWRAYNDSEIDADEFAEFFKAVTAFVALRRAATGGTKNIDGDLRLLMQKGDVAAEKFGGPQLDLAGDTSVPSINDFRNTLRYMLQRRPVYLSDKESWVEKAASNALYESNVQLCKFLLLAATQSSESFNTTYPFLRPVTPGISNEYLTLNAWTATDTETVEHIAPQRANNLWAPEIYTEPDLIHTLGNLMLFPKMHNSSLGNGSPQQKWPVYKALAAVDEKERQEEIEIAQREGADIKPKLQAAIHASRRLPLVESVAEFNDQWTADVIRKRSSNLAERAWDSISPWLDF